MVSDVVIFGSNSIHTVLKLKKIAKLTKFITFCLAFWVKNGLFKGQYLMINSLGNILSKFYHNLYLPKTIEKWVY